ncbi:hypothetical protein V5O48_005227 [Marasmius crinis-equi]|uniref:F-box domain-containing protein n=1 Tax=Marasmius crinis-equi TaxID=585013 RepID=A0ABR3FNA9_9AGAR
MEFSQVMRTATRALDFPDEIWEQVFSEVIDTKGIHGLTMCSVRLHLVGLPTLLKELRWKDSEAFLSNLGLWERALKKTLVGRDGRLSVDGSLLNYPRIIFVGDPLSRRTNYNDAFRFDEMFNLMPKFPNLTVLCFAKIQIPLRSLPSAIAGIRTLGTLILIDVQEEPRPDNAAAPLEVDHDRVLLPPIRQLEIQGRYSITPLQTTLITILTLFSLRSVEVLIVDWFAFRSIWTYVLQFGDRNFPGDIVFDLPIHSGSGAETVKVSRPPRLSSFSLLVEGRVSWGNYAFDEPHRAARYLMQFLGRCGNFIEQVHVRGWVGGQYGYVDPIILPVLSDFRGPMHLLSYVRTSLSPLTWLSVSPSVYYENELVALAARVQCLPRVVRFEIAFKSLTTNTLNSLKDLFPNLEELYIYAVQSTLCFQDMLHVGEHFLCGLGSLQVLHLYTPLRPTLALNREQTVALIGVWSTYTRILREVRLSEGFYFFKRGDGRWVSARKSSGGWENQLLYNL